MKQEQNQLIRLDWVLDYMVTHAGQGAPQGDETWNKIREIHPTLHINIEGNENESYRKQIFDRLLADKLITLEKDDGRYWITLEGLIFTGYHHEKVQKMQEVQNGIARTLELTRATWSAGLGAFCLVMMEIVKLSYNSADRSFAVIQITTSLCVFAFGIGAGMIIYQIIKHLQEKKE